MCRGLPKRKSSVCDVVAAAAAAAAGSAPLRARALPERGASCAQGQRTPLPGALHRMVREVQ